MNGIQKKNLYSKSLNIQQFKRSPALSSNFHKLICHFSPFPAITSHLNQCQQISNYLNTFPAMQALSSLSQPISEYSSLFQQMFSIVLPILAFCSLLQPVQAYSSVSQPILLPLTKPLTTNHSPLTN